MSSETKQARRVFLVRASVFEPRTDGSAPALVGVSDMPEVLRQFVHGYITRDLELEVRLSSCVEITEGVHLAGATAEPTVDTPADVDVATLANPRDLAEAHRIMSGRSMMLPERRHLAALAAHAERWRMRAAARMDTPEGRQAFGAAMEELIAGAIDVAVQRGGGR